MVRSRNRTGPRRTRDRSRGVASHVVPDDRFVDSKPSSDRPIRLAFFFQNLNSHDFLLAELSQIPTPSGSKSLKDAVIQVNWEPAASGSRPFSQVRYSSGSLTPKIQVPVTDVAKRIETTVLPHYRGVQRRVV